MRDVVREIFPTWSEEYEGEVRRFYLDVKGLVTIAIGNLVDPIQYALTLPMVHADGTPATRDEIAAEWLKVKNDPDAARLGHRHTAKYTKLSLTDEGVAMLVSRKLEQNNAFLVKRFPDFECWPADAQLATHSLAWAAGPAFRFPKLEAALLAQDFASYTPDAQCVAVLTGGAAFHCHMNEAGNPGLKPRNKANKLLYENAAKVCQHGLDPEELYWPAVVGDPLPVVDEGSRIIRPEIDFVALVPSRQKPD